MPLTREESAAISELNALVKILNFSKLVKQFYGLFIQPIGVLTQAARAVHYTRESCLVKTILKRPP